MYADSTEIMTMHLLTFGSRPVQGLTGCEFRGMVHAWVNPRQWQMARMDVMAKGLDLKRS